MPAHPVIFQNLGQVEYGRSLKLMMNMVERKIKSDTEDRIYLAEHLPVFTVGRNGGEESLIIDPAFLKKRGIRIYKTGRGGSITYHGPGQAIMYPVLNLEKLKIGVKDFVCGLETVMQSTAKDFGVDVVPGDPNHGVWIDSRKLGSIGLGIRKGICFHGVALNIDMDLSPFSWINPCGLSGITISSIKAELSSQSNCACSVQDAHRSFQHHMCTTFNLAEKTMEPATP